MPQTKSEGTGHYRSLSRRRRREVLVGPQNGVDVGVERFWWSLKHEDIYLRDYGTVPALE